MHVDLAVFDVTGRLVRQVIQGPEDAGEHVAEWDGLTDGGKRATAGAYFARLSAGDAVLTEKIVLMR